MTIATVTMIAMDASKSVELGKVTNDGTDRGDQANSTKDARNSGGQGSDTKDTRREKCEAFERKSGCGGNSQSQEQGPVKVVAMVKLFDRASAHSKCSVG